MLVKTGNSDLEVSMKADRHTLYHNLLQANWLSMRRHRDRKVRICQAPSNSRSALSQASSDQPQLASRVDNSPITSA